MEKRAGLYLSLLIFYDFLAIRIFVPVYRSSYNSQLHILYLLIYRPKMHIQYLHIQ